MWSFVFMVLLQLLHHGIGNNIADSELPLVQTKLGSIRGLRATDGNYSMFLGIPYAVVNASNPFGLNIPNPTFDQVFEANDDSAICPQLSETNSVLGSLDCLHLNIHVPDTANINNPLPVLLYIHGGGFYGGSFGRNNFGARHLIKQDIIVITINYRLGVFGFMCLDIPEVPGNQGLKDQLTAIRWVKENIAAFGGDGNKITIMGESAGAGSVDYLLRFSEPNLFDKVIIISGTATAGWAFLEYPDYNHATRLANVLNFQTSNTYEALDYLATKNVIDILFGHISLLSIMSVCEEKEFSSVDRLVTSHPANSVASNIKSTSILIGYNQDESGTFATYDPDISANLIGVFEDYARGLNFPDDLAKEVGQKLKQFYIGDNMVNSENVREIANFITDTSFIYPTETAINYYIEKGATNLYRYLFSYYGERNYLQKMQNFSFEGALHSDSLGYLFDASFLPEPNDQDQLMIDRMTTMWGNFVKYGDPTPQTSQLLPKKWLPIAPGSSHYIHLDKELYVGTRPLRERITFLDLVHMMSDDQAGSFTKNKSHQHFFIEILKILGVNILKSTWLL